MDELRLKGGKKALIIALVANCFLTVANIIVGYASGSYALVSEGAHTFSDIATSIIAYVGFYTGQKPADKWACRSNKRINYSNIPCSYIMGSY